MRRSLLQLSRPIQNGVVKDWEGMEALGHRQQKHSTLVQRTDAQMISNVHASSHMVWLTCTKHYMLSVMPFAYGFQGENVQFSRRSISVRWGRTENNAGIDRSYCSTTVHFGKAVWDYTFNKLGVNPSEHKAWTESSDCVGSAIVFSHRMRIGQLVFPEHLPTRRFLAL